MQVADHATPPCPHVCPFTGLQDVLAPTPTNISVIYVTAAQARSRLSVSQWAERHLQGIDALPLLEGCYVLVPAKVGGAASAGEGVLRGRW